MGKANECVLLMLSLEWWETLLDVVAGAAYDVGPPDRGPSAQEKVSWGSFSCLFPEPFGLCELHISDLHMIVSATCTQSAQQGNSTLLPTVPKNEFICQFLRDLEKSASVATAYGLLKIE